MSFQFHARPPSFATAVLCLLAVVGPGPISAQQVGTVTGAVTDAASGAVLPSVQVHIPALRLGALSNDQGRFLLLNVPAGRHEFRAELLGRRSVTQIIDVPSGGTITLNFQLETSAISMEALVVTGVAAATPRSQLAFTVEQLNAAEVQRITPTSAGTMLQGKVPGAKVISGSGQPGSEPSIQLRGPTSITGSQAPLVIVDGVVTRGTLADIDPLDIESMEVVKGAAAASLYGSRAQAGVIMITTKRGASLPEGSSEIVVRNVFNVNSMPRRLELSRSHGYRMSPDGNSFVNRAGSPISLPATLGTFVFDDGGTGTNVYRAFQDKPYPEPTWDPVKQVFAPGGSRSTFISMGGNEGTTQYQASARYLHDEGSIRFNNGLTQKNVRLNVDHRLSDQLQLALGSYFAHSQSDVIEEGGLDMTGSATTFQRMTFLSPKSNLLDLNENGNISIIGDQVAWTENPLYRVVNQDFNRTRRRLMGNADLTYSPTSWVNFQASASYDRGDMLETRYEAPGYERIRNTPLQGSLFKREENSTELNASLTASLTRSFGHLVTRTRLRYVNEARENSGMRAGGSNMLVSSVPRLSLATAGLSLDSFEQAIRSEGLFLITALTYQDKYVLDLLGRRDGSSLFGPEERWQNYFRAAGAWRMAQEPWWPFATINEFKPRLSIGTAGGRPRFEAQYQTYAVADGSISPRILGNDRLRPEHATERETGFDAVIANRLRVGASYVSTEVKDQLLLVPLPAFAGFESQWRNAGTLESTTWELALEAALVERPNLLWTARLNLDRTKQTITELLVPAYRIEDYRAGMWVREGEELGTFYGLKWANDCGIDLRSGTDCSQFQVNDDGLLVWVGAGNSWKDGFAKNLWGTTTNIGGVVYHFGTPIPSILDNRLTKMGKSQPDLNASLFQDLNWGNLGLSFLLDGEWGAQVYNQTRAFGCRDYRCPEADQAGKPDYAKKPVAYYGVPGVYARNENSTWFMEDADFVKLREVSIRYTLDQRSLPGLTQRVGLDRATINLTGRNVKTWTQYTGYDPEVGTDSFLGSAAIGRIDEYFYPNFRSFGIDIEMVFSNTSGQGR